VDLAFELPGEGRFRVNISRQRRFYNIVLRVIPLEIRSFDELNLPHVLRTSRRSRGYVLVTGATGMGKSTTLATMIQE
jgi:Tfp pilus assembly pilus retraction ATPase PilT